MDLRTKAAAKELTDKWLRSDVAIRKSASTDVEGLIADLRSAAMRESRREAALARLAVIGSRAVGHLLNAFERARDDQERQSLLAALERIPDTRSIEAVLSGIGPSNQHGRPSVPVRAAAIRAARPLLTLAPHLTMLLERLTVLVLDAGEPLSLRRAALDALDELPSRTTEPIRRRLLADPDPAVRAMVSGAPDLAGRPSDSGPGEPLPSDDPIVALDFVGRVGREAPLSVLHGLLATVREREAGGGRRRPDWTAVRGAIHVALARRGSRVGLYDLREAFESDALHPLHADFTVAVRLIGDATCLEPLALAWMCVPASTRDGRNRAWAQEVRDAFSELLARERPAARRRVISRLETRWRAAADAKRLRELVGGVRKG